MMDNAKIIVDRLLATFLDRKKPGEAEKQTPHDVLADTRAELDRLRDKANSLDDEIEAATAEVEAAAIDDALGVKGAAAKVVEIESRIATLSTRRASINKTVAALESPAGIPALEAEAAEYDRELKREADKATAREALKHAKAKHKTAVAALEAAQKAVQAIDDEMARTILGAALRGAGEGLVCRTMRHNVKDWGVEAALTAAESRLRLAAEGKAPDSWIQPYAPVTFDPLANMTPLGRAMWEHRQPTASKSTPAEANLLNEIDRLKAQGLSETQIEEAWRAA